MDRRRTILLGFGMVVALMVYRNLIGIDFRAVMHLQCKEDIRIDRLTRFHVRESNC